VTFGEARVMRYAKEDASAKAAARVAVPLVTALAPGRNYYGRKQFDALARFLLVDERPVAKAVHEGRFAIGRIEVVFVEQLGSGRLLSVNAIALASGVPQRTLARRVAKLALPFVLRGKQKLYDIDDLRAALAKAR
jgi:hypothetical protein